MKCLFILVLAFVCLFGFFVCLFVCLFSFSFLLIGVACFFLRLTDEVLFLG